MPWWAPIDWTNGVIVADTDLDQQVRDNLRYLKGLDGRIDLDHGVRLTRGVAGGLGPQLELINSAAGDVSLDLHGGYAIGANDPAARIRAIQNNSSADLVFLTKLPGAQTNSLVERLRLHAGGGANLRGNLDIGPILAADAVLQIGANGNGNRNSYLDLIGDDMYTDYGLRVARYNGGANAISEVKHRGTGALVLNAQDAGALSLRTLNTERLGIDAAGNVTAATSLKVGTGTIAGGLGPQPFAAANNGATYCFVSDQTNTLIYGADAAGSTLLGSFTNTPFHLRTNNTNRLTIRETTGRVGIGTTDPQGRLHVSESLGSWVTWSGNVAASNTSGNRITLVPSGVSTVAGVFFVYSNSSPAARGAGTTIAWSSGTGGIWFNGSTDSLILEIVGGALQLYRSGSSPTGTSAVVLWIMYF